MTKYLLVTIYLSTQFIYADCNNSELADINEDNLINILDIVGIVDFIMIANEVSDQELILLDINSDSNVNILDVMKLVNKVLIPEPEPISFNEILINSNTIEFIWEISNSPIFKSYSLYYSYSNSSTDKEFIAQINSQLISTYSSTNLTFFTDIWFWVDITDLWDCSSSSILYHVEHHEKNYILDEYGHILESEIFVEDFPTSENCIACHENHVNEWKTSRHHKAMQNSLFLTLWNDEIQHHPLTGERFCIQCHNPPAFVTGTEFLDVQTVDDLSNGPYSENIKDGISCTFCHSITDVSSTYFASDDLSPSAEYHLYPGENVYFGSIENPEITDYHFSQFSPLFHRSEMCLPCHDMVVRNVEAEITFTEWNRIPGFAMSGGVPCQECHMPEKADGTHDHNFVGVDIDLAFPIGLAPQYELVQNMLESAVTLEFGAPGYTLPDTVQSGSDLILPITVTSLTAHNIPSGTSFTRDVWVEVLIASGGVEIYTSGLIMSNSEPLNREENELLIFASYLIDENGDTTLSVSDTHDIINETLPALADRFHLYNVQLPSDLGEYLDISVTMKFRAFRPSILSETHPEFLANQPVYDMASINTQLPIVGD